ncbi:hypothetical protein RJ639_040313 [Escallonia herrerae]|uniref:Cytochrome P450 n=1 Tax=Escallonia herrerae TaxID=1293975 RepID=A0AA89B1K1_9ASTE|nr:hypothetical protein RJ639_040313 [Escallonia herrerae]
MMIQFSSFPLVIFALVFVLTLMVKHWKKSRIQKLPPGPMKLPVIGNLHQLITGSSIPHVALKRLAGKYGPIMHLQLGEGSAIVISSPEAAEEVLKKHELVFAQRPSFFANDVAGYGNLGLFFAPNGSFWRHIRKICTVELLGARQVRSFKTLRQEEVESLTESIASTVGSSLNLSEKILQTTNSITSRAAFGNKCRDAVDFLAIIKEGNEFASGFDLPDLFPSLKFVPFVSRMKPTLENLKHRMDNVLDNIINEHKAKRTISDTDYSRGEYDILDVLLGLQDDSNNLECPITTTIIKAIVMDIFAAGTETTATTIEWAMAEMLKDPTVLEKVQAEVRRVLKGKKNISQEDINELHYLKLVIKETLRLHPPGALMPRESKEDCEINGYYIPAKTKAIINVWAIGRDPKHWDDPNCFKPERLHQSSINYTGTNFEYLPFGAGTRMCPGISFGVATIELQLALMLYHFNFKLSDGIMPEELDMTESCGFTAKKKHELRVIAIPAPFPSHLL